MRTIGIALALACGAFVTSAAAEEWTADGPTCSSAYDALNQRKADLITLSPDARGAANFDKIDFDARASDPKLLAGVPEYQQGEAFVNAVTEARGEERSGVLAAAALSAALRRPCAGCACGGSGPMIA